MAQDGQDAVARYDPIPRNSDEVPDSARKGQRRDARLAL
jgi:hypothetical protein